MAESAATDRRQLLLCSELTGDRDEDRHREEHDSKADGARHQAVSPAGVAQAMRMRSSSPLMIASRSSSLS